MIFLEPSEEDLEMMESMPEDVRNDYFRRIYLFHHATACKRTPEFLIEDFLPLGYCVILAGEPKAGKTALASAIALAVAEGSPFAAMESTKAGVLWLALEESTEERATIMTPIRERLMFANFWVSHEKIAIDSEQGLSDIEYWVNETEAKLIVVDPLHAAHSGRSLNDGWAARRSLEPFKRFCASKGVTGLVLHHLGIHRSRVAENAQLAACAGMSMLYTSQPAESGRLIRLQSSGRGAFANRTWFFESAGPLSYWPAAKNVLSRALPASGENADRPKVTLDDQVLQFLTNSPTPRSASQIAQSLRYKAGSVRNAISRLIPLGKVVHVGTISGARYYDIPRDPPHAPLEIMRPEDLAPTKPKDPEVTTAHFPHDDQNDDAMICAD